MKTLGQYSWKQLIRNWLLLEQHYPSLIKIVSAHQTLDHLQSTRGGFLGHCSTHTGLSIVPLQSNLVNSRIAHYTFVVV